MRNLFSLDQRIFPSETSTFSYFNFLVIVVIKLIALPFMAIISAAIGDSDFSEEEINVDDHDVPQPQATKAKPR